MDRNHSSLNRTPVYKVMPIIINEIEVSVAVSDNESGRVDAGNNSSKAEIIKECVEQIIAIINNKNER